MMYQSVKYCYIFFDIFVIVKFIIISISGEDLWTIVYNDRVGVY